MGVDFGGLAMGGGGFWGRSGRGGNSHPVSAGAAVVFG